jgi:CubicO group peptidase (beta-lactamase class C family)
MRFITLSILLIMLTGNFVIPTQASGINEPASSIDFVEIDQHITAQMDKHGLKGIALAITQADQVLYLKGYGTAGQGRSMTPQTPMYIGSQSKSITGMALAQLIEQGKVNLNDPVIDYIPWFGVADPDATKKITISDLVYHKSGLSEEGYTTIVPDNASLEEGIRSLSTATLTAPIGTKFQYFNMGYCVLMQVIENVSGQKYAEYIQEHIFTPLGMTQSYTDPISARADGLSQGYSRFFGFTLAWPQPHVGYQLGDGYIISTAEDLAHYVIAMNNRGSYQDESLLSPEMLKRMFMSINGYGMGWFIMPDHINHGGANETFKTYVDLYPSRGLGIVLLINQGYMLDHFISADQVFYGVQSIALGKIPPPISQGWSVKVIGWGLLGFVVALCVLHVWNFTHLRGWKIKSRTMSMGKKIFGVSISFIIPTVILIIVYSQVKGFFGTRFNLTYQVLMMFKTLPDISVLFLVGTIPDYVQGIIKLGWVLKGEKGEQE